MRRPGIRDVVEADLRLLARLAEIVEARLPDLRRYRPAEVVQQFTVSLRRELDFAAECRNAERIARNFSGRDDIPIPKVHWQWTCESLNVQDFVEGIPGRDLAGVDAAGLDRRELARRGAGIVLKMVLEDGSFHADPHPGNIIYLRDGRIGVIDFGMVGASEVRRFQVAQLLHGLVEQDPQGVADVLLDWAGGVEVDENRLQHDISQFVDQYRGVPLKDLRIGLMLGDIPVAAQLQPDPAGGPGPDDQGLPDPGRHGPAAGSGFRHGQRRASVPGAGRAAALCPRALLKRGRRSLLGLVDFAGELPRDLRKLVQAARRGRLQLKVETTALQGFGEQVNRAANRLVVGVITAALIIGSSIVMHSVGGVSSRWLLALGVCGFIGAGFCGVWILFSIWRSGKHA